jgi:hypothetical protein
MTNFHRLEMWRLRRHPIRRLADGMRYADVIECTGCKSLLRGGVAGFFVIPVPNHFA